MLISYIMLFSFFWLAAQSFEKMMREFVQHTKIKYTLVHSMQTNTHTKKNIKIQVFPYSLSMILTYMSKHTHNSCMWDNISAFILLLIFILFPRWAMIIDMDLNGNQAGCAMEEKKQTIEEINIFIRLFGHHSALEQLQNHLYPFVNEFSSSFPYIQKVSTDFSCFEWMLGGFSFKRKITKTTFI